MKKKKIIFNHIKMFLLTLYLLLTTLVIVCRGTILSRTFIETQITEEHYQKVETSLKEEMKNSMISSGIDSKVIDSMFTKSDVKNTISQTLDIIYNYHNQKLDTSNIEEKLKKNVDQNLKEKNYKIENQRDYQTFINSIMKIYRNEFTMLNQVTKIGKYMSIIIKLFSIISILLGTILGIIIILRNKKIKELLPVPLFATSFILLFGTWYINETAGLNSITIFSKTFSDLLRKIISNTFLSIRIISIIYIILALILHLFLIHHHRRHRKHKETEV